VVGVKEVKENAVGKMMEELLELKLIS